MKIFKNDFQPCCGFSLKWAVRIMSILNVLMVLIGFSLYLLDIYQFWDAWQTDKAQNISRHYTRLGIWICYFIHMTSSLPNDYVLYRCSKTENICHLRACFYATLINNTFALIVYYFHTFSFGIHFLSLAIYNGYMIYKYYECSVVRSFIKEIVEEREFSSAKRAMTDAEILEFEEGMRNPPFDIETRALLEKVNYERFKKEEYEISMHQLRFDMSNILGQGAYGCVYRAQLESNDGYETTVAVKMINPDDTDIVFFKALLSEVKIMSCIGKHENIIRLIGATTKDLKQRKLSLVLEFCAFGNMSDYLKQSRGLFRNMLRNGEISTQKGNHYDASPFDTSELVSTQDLIRWTYEIALGMEFLESRKVIHGDLACRNLLLTAKRVIKITDFGLARQLYAYSVYVRKQNTPLPWRYLAPESLTDMAFSSSSDVWSYGITLTEVFSLGEIPWPGYDFSLMFVEELKRGMKPRPPPYSPNFIYEKVMLRCWESDSSARPNFTEIANLILQQYNNLITP